VIDTALILSLSSWLNVCQYGLVRYDVLAQLKKIAKGLLAP